MSEATFEELAEAIRRTHGGEPRFVEAVAVHETFEDETVWDGVVFVFDLSGHPTATRAYAWSHRDQATETTRFIAVLHSPPVDSPVSAVRASIVKEYRDSGKGNP